ncbi:MAG: glycosyltransferase [Anaerolineae bacterium]|nr:glycosyltransferase [Anaerolineae bacterium]
MRLLFVATLHHPQALEDARRAAPSGGDRLFPPSQAQHFWVKALRRQGHDCAVFWRSASALPWARPRQLRMTQRLTPARAIGALAGRVPALNPDIRLRNRRLLAQAADFQPDAIILIGDNRVVLPETLARLRREHGAALVYASGTSPVVFSHAIERAAAPLYDLAVTNDFYHAIQWRELGARRVEALPLAAIDPEFHHPFALSDDEQVRYRCAIGFVGTLVPPRLYGERIAALEALRDFDLGIWSVHEVPPSLRPFYRGSALGAEMLRATAAGQIALNPHGDFMRWGGNMRLFEACGVGAFQLVDDRPGVREWFRDGEHLVIYRDHEHLRELVRYYLAHDGERRQIADAGRAHVLAHHTYDQRMARLVNLIEDIRED